MRPSTAHVAGDLLPGGTVGAEHRVGLFVGGRLEVDRVGLDHGVPLAVAVDASRIAPSPLGTSITLGIKRSTNETSPAGGGPFRSRAIRAPVRVGDDRVGIRHQPRVHHQADGDLPA